MVPQLALLITLSFFQVAGAKPAGAEMIGTWSTTAAPPAGEAPLIPPSFTVELRDGKLGLYFTNKSEFFAATVFPVSKTQSILVVKTPLAGGGTQMTILRTVAPGQVRLEAFMDYGGPGNYYHVETFKKSG